MNAPLDLLAMAIRTQARTVAELAELAHQPADRIRSELSELATLGLVLLDGDTISYPRQPDRVIVDHADSQLRSAGEELDRSLEAVRTLLASLPNLAHNWNLGNTDDHSLPIDILHGPTSPEDLFRLQAARGIPVFADAVIPDSRRLFASNTSHQAAHLAMMTAEGRRARCILSTRDATHPDAQERLTADAAAGIQHRMHPDPPSWFWINDDNTVGIPLHWGDPRPTSVMAVTSTAIASLARYIFDRLWEQSVPVHPVENDWTPLLKLMRAGATTETAAQSLGLSARTGRRRISEAMVHYGTHTLFGLGAAWQREQQESNQP